MTILTWNQNGKVSGAVDGKFEAKFTSEFFNIPRFIPDVSLYYQNTFDLFGKPNIGIFPVKITKKHIRKDELVIIYLDYVDEKTKCLLLGIESFTMKPGQGFLGSLKIDSQFDLAVDFGIPVFRLITTKSDAAGDCDFMLG